MNNIYYQFIKYKTIDLIFAYNYYIYVLYMYIT